MFRIPRHKFFLLLYLSALHNQQSFSSTFISIVTYLIFSFLKLEICVPLLLTLLQSRVCSLASHKIFMKKLSKPFMQSALFSGMKKNIKVLCTYCKRVTLPPRLLKCKYIAVFNFDEILTAQ